MKAVQVNLLSLFSLPSATLLIATLSACGGSVENSGNGQLSLAITDAPVDEAEQVVIRFSGVTIHASDSDNLEFVFCDNQLTASDAPCNNPTVRQIDLMQLTGTHSQPLITDATIPAGNYQWMRLELDDTRPGYFVPTVGGGEYDLTIPSGAQTGLKLNKRFNLQDEEMVSFTVDFDLRKSVHKTGGGDYKLRPTLRLVTNTNVGSIYGIVDATLINPGPCTPAVYLYEGSNITPNDEGGQGETPVTTAIVTQDSGSGDYVYEIGFVEAGDYTLAFTCEADQDDPETDDSITFAVTTNSSVNTNTSTETNIP